MIIIRDPKDCCGCTACVAACPVSCIEMASDHEGFDYPVPDPSRCIACGRCAQVCPVLNQVQNRRETVVYACHNKNAAVRFESSSGGVFTLLASRVLEKGGAVFGARFNEDFDVVHAYAKTPEELAPFRGSKYAQSRMGDCFREVARFLEQGIEVLFSGTPCQIAGLKKFLGKHHPNLSTVDLICHGVPSPKVFKLYRRALERKYRSEITSYSFRDKKSGWKEYSTKVEFVRGKYCRVYHDDVYMNGFLDELYLRPSCHACCAKNFQSDSDLTLADFWGVENFHRDLDDDLGTSLVFVNSPRGQADFEEISRFLVMEKTTRERAIRYNPSWISSAKAHKNRETFFAMIDKRPVVKAIERYGEQSTGLLRACKRLAKRLISKKGIERIKKLVKRFK